MDNLKYMIKVASEEQEKQASKMRSLVNIVKSLDDYGATYSMFLKKDIKNPLKTLTTNDNIKSGLEPIGKLSLSHSEPVKNIKDIKEAVKRTDYYQYPKSSIVNKTKIEDEFTNMGLGKLLYGKAIHSEKELGQKKFVSGNDRTGYAYKMWKNMEETRGAYQSENIRKGYYKSHRGGRLYNSDKIQPHVIDL